MPMPDWMFISLSAEEEVPFRKWARDNHKPGQEISEGWHPVVRDECRKMDREARRLTLTLTIAFDDDAVPPAIERVFVKDKIGRAHV